MMKKIKGDLIKMAKQGKFDAIVQGCNCFCVQGAGLAPQMNKHFGTLQYSLEEKKYSGDYNKLGVYQAKSITTNSNGITGWTEDIEPCADDVKYDVINAYTQYRYDTGKDFDMLAFTLICQKLNHAYRGKHLGFPWIGCGRAGAQKYLVEHTIKMTMPDVEVTIVEYDGNDPGSKI